MPKGKDRTIREVPANARFAQRYSPTWNKDEGLRITPQLEYHQSAGENSALCL
jgi:hypothetical protein